jgi:hypothetical protein
MSHREQGPWRDFVDDPPGEPPPRRVEGPGALRATFVGHSTVLLQLDGLNVLTDPIWSERASPVAFAGPKRIRPPGIRFEDLPPIDRGPRQPQPLRHLDLPTQRRPPSGTGRGWWCRWGTSGAGQGGPARLEPSSTGGRRRRSPRA